MTCRIEPAASRSPAPAGPPLPEPLGWIAAAWGEIRARGLERRLRLRTGRQGRAVVLDGRPLVNFGANDYLGYAGDVRLAKAAAKAACAEGFGAGASPLVSGHSAAHDRLERAIAELLAVDAALVFPSGFAANTAAIAALVGPGDLIVSDARNHASIIDGCRLSRADISVYPHRDMRALDAALVASPAAQRRLVVTDTLFSMDGTVAPLADLCEIARRHGAMVLVDEAHATGVFGERGSGLVEAAGCADGVHVRVGTLSKALGAGGGFVAGHADLIRWLAHAARPWIFSTAHPPAVAAAAWRAVELLAEEPHRRHELLDRAADVRDRLAHAGISVGGDAQILPLVVGTAEAAVAAAAHLADEGLFVPAIRPPSVPAGESLLRASLSWHHSTDDLDRLVRGLLAVAGGRSGA